jgi:hypothetical protein
MGKLSRYTVKKVGDIPIPSRDVTYQTLRGRKLFPPRDILVIGIRLGTGMSLTFFFGVQ